MLHAEDKNENLRVEASKKMPVGAFKEILAERYELKADDVRSLLRILAAITLRVPFQIRLFNFYGSFRGRELLDDYSLEDGRIIDNQKILMEGRGDSEYVLTALLKWCH